MAIRRRIAAAAMARIPSNVRRVQREIGDISRRSFFGCGSRDIEFPVPPAYKNAAKMARR
jgi:hypothetical protein